MSFLAIENLIDSGDGHREKGCCLNIVDHNNVEDGFHDSNEYKVRLRCLFNQILEVYLENAADKGCIRHIPARLGDGRPLDLFKLFWLVRERGGFRMVSDNHLWVIVVQELGLDFHASASVKLVYAKYLNELEKWLMGNGGFDGDENFSSLSLEVENQFRFLSAKWLKQKIKGERSAKPKYQKNGNYVDFMDFGESELRFWEAKNTAGNARKNGLAKRCYYGDAQFYDNDEKVSDKDIDLNVFQKDLTCRKRKRESLSKMLNWVVQVATCPVGPTMGADLKNEDDKALWMMAIKAREALLHKIKQSLPQNGQKLHPSLAENVANHSQPTTEKLRCSERLPSAKSRLCPCCHPCSATESKPMSPRKVESEANTKDKTPVAATLLTTDSTFGRSGNETHEKHVGVGPFFQATVPEWTGVVHKSDSKWLGTRIWPLETGNQKMNPLIGRGRQDSCECRLPGSVGCVRFHIAENRVKLKLELGLVFYHWRFDKMGEEVLLQWTVEEEKRFKDIVIFRPQSLSWNNASNYFQRKTREDLISYYFNVFVINRRRYQNRVWPKDIDSDDDEYKFGSVGGSFGDEAVNSARSDMLMCFQNNQCTDLE